MKHNTDGFSLIELLLYIAIVSALILASSVFLKLIFASRVKNQVIAEVEQQGMQVMQLITQTVRNAAVINTPGPGQSANSLSVDSTVFDLSSATIRITEGAGSLVSLTNSRISASSLSFRNLSFSA